MKTSKGQGVTAGLVAAFASTVITRMLVDREIQGWVVYELVWLAVFVGFWFATVYVYRRIAHKSEASEQQS